MSYTQPDLSQILQNETTLNNNLTTAQTRLRSILDKEEIGYTSGDGVIPLIRKLPVPELASINIYFENMFTTGANVNVEITTRDTNGDLMPNANVDMYRLDTTAWGQPVINSLGTITTGSNGKATLSVSPPSEKGFFYIQGRNDNIVGGQYGVYCTTAVNVEDLNYSNLNSGLFSANGRGSSSGFSIMEAEPDGNYMDVYLEAHSGYSGNYFGLSLSNLGTYTTSELEGHKFYALMSDITGTTGRWMGFGICANIDDWSNLRIGAGAKYNYGDGSGANGYRQVMENISPYGNSNDSDDLEPAGIKLYQVNCDGSFSPRVWDVYSGDPTVEYPDYFVSHGTWNVTMLDFKTGTYEPSIIFNFPDRYSYRGFRIYGAGVI